MNIIEETKEIRKETETITKTSTYERDKNEERLRE
jgi:hypothetical protein